MERADVVSFPVSSRERAQLKETGLNRLVLEKLVLEQYDAEASAIARYVVFLGVESETAREIVQESFLKLYQHLQAGGDRSNLRAWLYRVSHNLARNSQTSFDTRNVYPLPISGPEFRDGAVSPEDTLLERERLDRLRQGIASLSESARECLMLRSQGLKYREIAEVLNLSVSTVGGHIGRGLEQLKEML